MTDHRIEQDRIRQDRERTGRIAGQDPVREINSKGQDRSQGMTDYRIEQITELKDPVRELNRKGQNRIDHRTGQDRIGQNLEQDRKDTTGQDRNILNQEIIPQKIFRFV
jgi:hypothetical protein